MFDAPILIAAALAAGFVDAIVGGGGLILVPALFSVFPQAAPATLFGTNKGAAIWGTAWSTAQYARRVQLPWSTLLPAAAATLLGSLSGAWCVTQIDGSWLRKALPLLLLGLLVYTLMRKDLGREHRPRWQGRREAAVASLIGLAIGFYDGFFGPGTGSFFVFLLVRLLGYDFLNASASAKLLNCAANASALTLFAATGHVWWGWALAMAVANVAGSLLGTRLALRHGAGFVRGMFLVVVGGLILKTGWDAWLR
ncbi:TSUP family transporter [Piscinibacter sp. Jin2]|uniref:Probable membrane transporter protein n=1 Tax=Aquariibacter lacus TaxID=2801332 RepID=A0A9X1BMR4_9BURK|nr:TSUP family transporter [Piscinibacter lacus]MBL0718545.1 TSUP family transporter [Piscinibacter lacus]